MMKAAIAILILALLLLLGYCLFGKKTPPPIVVPPPEQVEDRGVNASDAAQKMVALLPKLIDSQTFASMGFRTLKEVGEAEKGSPIPLLRLRCDSIMKPDPSRGENLELMAIAKLWIYPVLVGGKVRTAILVDSIPDSQGKSKADWVAVEVGKPGLLRLVDSSVESHSKTSGIPASAYSVVEVPALGQWFLTYTTAEGPMMIPLKIRTPFGCQVGKAGEAMRVSAVLGALQKCPEVAKVCRVRDWEAEAKRPKSGPAAQ